MIIVVRFSSPAEFPDDISQFAIRLLVIGLFVHIASMSMPGGLSRAERPTAEEQDIANQVYLIYLHKVPKYRISSLILSSLTLLFISLLSTLDIMYLIFDIMN